MTNEATLYPERHASSSITSLQADYLIVGLDIDGILPVILHLAARAHQRGKICRLAAASGTISTEYTKAIQFIHAAGP